jgi:hypothetical protein
MQSPEHPEGVTMSQPHPSTGQPAGPLRPAVPAPVLTAVRFMYGGAAIAAAVFLVTGLPVIGDIHGRLFGHRFSATPLTITLVIVIFGLIPTGLWLWMARAVGRGRNWARILSTVLFVLATLELISSRGVVPVFAAALTWLIGLGAVWLLWRPASRAFFKPQLRASSAVVYSAAAALPGQDGGVHIGLAHAARAVGDGAMRMVALPPQHPEG